MINKQLINLSSPASSGGGYANQEEGLILHLDANDVDSYDGDGTEWVDISSYNINPNTLTQAPPALSTPTPVISYATNDANSYDGTTTLKNLSSGSYNATLGGATYSDNDGTSLSFNNSSNVLNTTYTSSGLSAVTWEGWFKLDAVGSQEAIGSFSVNGGNVAIFATHTNTNTPQGYYDYVYVKHADLVGDWVHIAIKFSGWAGSYSTSAYGAGISAQVYINGSSTGTVTVTPYGQSSTYNTLFRVMGNVSTYRAGGLFSELRFYESGLSDADVATNYNHGRVKFNELETANLQLHLDAGDDTTVSTSTWSDKTSNNNNVTLTNFSSTLTDFYEKEVGNYIEFDGLNDIATSTLPVTATGDVTMEVWVRYTDSTSASIYPYITHLGNGNVNGSGFSMARFANTGSNAYKFYCHLGGSYQVSNKVLEEDRWYHVCATWVGTSLKQYVDGELVGNHTLTFNKNLYNAFTVGAYRPSNVAYTHRLKGDLGQVRVYQSALTSNQVKSNYLFTAPLYPNGNDGILGGGITGSVTSSAKPTWNPNGYFTFDNVNKDKVAFPDIINSHSTTVCAWVRGNGTWFMPSSEIYAPCTTAGFYWGSSGTSHAISGIQDGNWHHLAAAVTSARTVNYYVDGVLSYAATSSTDFPRNYNYQGATHNFIGHFYHPATPSSLTGDISKFNVFDRGLSAAEIAVIYDRGHGTSAGGGGAPDAVINNAWRAWDSASFTNGGTSCNDVINGLTLGPYGLSGNPAAFFYGSYNNVAGSKYWVMNGTGAHARRAGFTRPTEFSVSYWGNKPNNPAFNSERGIWSFNALGTNCIRLARRNDANTQSLRIYSGNSTIATFADGINLNTWYNITLTFSANTVKTYVGVQGGSATTLVNETTIGGTFPTGVTNNGASGFWIGCAPDYTGMMTDSWSSLSIYDGVMPQSQIDTIVSNGYQQ